MHDRAGERVRGGYHEPRIIDYGSLERLTADAGLMMMRQLGVTGGAISMVSPPAVPGGGGDMPGGGEPPVPRADAPFETGAVGGETTAPAAAGEDVGGGGAGDVAAPEGEPEVGGVTAEVSERGGLGGEDELPFTGLNVAGAAAAGAASVAAGAALRKVAAEEKRRR